MPKGLVISAIFALGIAVGCSQQDGTTTRVDPEDTVVSSHAVSTPADQQTTLNPTPNSEAIVPPLKHR